MGAGVFLLLSLLTQFGFDRMIRDAGYPGSRMISLPTPCSACSSSSSAIKDATATATTPFRRSPRTLRRPQHLAQEFLLGRCQPASPSAKSQVFSCANANPLRGNQLVEVLCFVEYWHDLGGHVRIGSASIPSPPTIPNSLVSTNAASQIGRAHV